LAVLGEYWQRGERLAADLRRGDREACPPCPVQVCRKSALSPLFFGGAKVLNKFAQNTGNVFFVTDFLKKKRVVELETIAVTLFDNGDRLQVKKRYSKIKVVVKKG
jgi:hypothetical protein